MFPWLSWGRAVCGTAENPFIVITCSALTPETGEDNQIQMQTEQKIPQKVSNPGYRLRETKKSTAATSDMARRNPPLPSHFVALITIAITAVLIGSK